MPQGFYPFRYLLIIACLAPQCARSAIRPDPPTSKAHTACLDKSEGVTVTMRECDADEFERQDREREKLYNSLSTMLGPKSQILLQTSERAWIAYRDATCDFEGSAGADGTRQLGLRQACRVRETAYRIEGLKQRLQFVKAYPEDDDG